jgi:hypothetical protein
VSAALGGAPGVVRSLSLTNSANGGAGFNGCLSNPLQAGSDGGPASLFNPMGVPYTKQQSFRGGDGGDGLLPGSGGAAGHDEAANQAIGVSGIDGAGCAATIELNTSKISVDFPLMNCGTVPGQITLTNHGGTLVTIQATVVDQVGLTGLELADPQGGFNVSVSFSALPNASTQLGYMFDTCQASNTAQGEVQFSTGGAAPFAHTTVMITSH